jgi:ankyrin repeat protein
MAAREGKVYVARALLKAGADKSLKDSTGKTPAEVALLNGHGGIRELK